MYGHILDNLNALGMLDDARMRLSTSVLCSGPLSVVSKNEYEGVVIWYRPKGYYAYKQLTLIGIWIYHTEDDIIYVAMGQHSLSYSAAFFNPESYFHQIQRSFVTYYNGEVTPFNLKEIFFKTRYNEKERIEIRRNMEQILFRRLDERKGF